LLPVSVGADLLGRVAGRPSLTQLGGQLMPPATASMALSALAGAVAQGAVRADGHARDMLVTHRTLNVGLFAAALVMTVVRARRRPGPLYLLAGVAAAAGMSYSAYLGGKMVYQHGVDIDAAGGVRDGASPEITASRIAHATRVAAADAAHALADAARDARDGRVAPVLGTRSPG